MKNQHDQYFWLLTLSIFCTYYMYPCGGTKIYRVKTDSRTAYTRYDPKKPGHTVTVHKNLSTDSYGGNQRKGRGSMLATHIKPNNARALFLDFEKVHIN